MSTLLPRNEVPVLLDRPAASVALFKRQVDIATNIITTHAADGFTMAVYGPWGSGKTTVLNGIKKEISSNSNIIEIDFDAWRYDRSGDIDAMLAKEFDNRFKRVTGSEKSAFFKRVIGSSTLGDYGWDLGAAMASSSFDWKAFLIGAGLMGAGKLANKFSEMKDGPKEMDLLEVATSLLEGDDYLKGFSTISKALEKNHQSIVVFLDDLDRCDPDTIASVISSLHVVMRQPRISFVLALDHDYLVKAITKQFDNWFPLGEEEEFADRYLEKIIQIPITVPTLNTSLVSHDNYIEDRNRQLFYALVNEGHTSVEASSSDTLSPTELASKIARYKDYGIIPGAESGTSSARPFELFMNRIAPLALRRNPRQMKRFLNTYVLSVNAKWEYVHADEHEATDIECDFMRLLGFRFLDPKQYTEMERRVFRYEGLPRAPEMDQSHSEDNEPIEPTLADVMNQPQGGDGGTSTQGDAWSYIRLTHMDTITIKRALELFDMVSDVEGGTPNDRETMTADRKQSSREMVQAELIPLVRRYPQLLNDLSSKQRAVEVVSLYTNGKKFRNSYYAPFSKTMVRSADGHPRYLVRPIKNLGPHGNETYFFSSQWYEEDIPIVDEFCENYELKHPIKKH